PFSNSTSKQQGVNNNDTYKDTYANTQHPFSNSTSKQQGVNNNDTYKDTYANTQHPFISTGNRQSHNGRRSSWVGVEDKRGVNYIRRGSMYMDRCYEPSNSKISNNSNISNTISVLEDTKSCTSVDTPLCSESDILPIITKGPWSEEEDNKLLLLIKKYKPKNWSFIAKMMKTRVGKQCRERWHNHLNPDIKKGPFSLQEEEVIMHYHKKIGNRWSEISKKLPGRTDNSIKNHYNSSLRRSIIRVLVYSSSYKGVSYIGTSYIGSIKGGVVVVIRVLEYSSSGVKGMVIVVVIRVLVYSSSGVKGMVIVGLEGVSYIGIIKVIRVLEYSSSYKGVSYIGSSYIGSIKGMVEW
ncbi:Myb-like DNA-binding domain-containing protein, partial [Hamiltosporidium magnivora]